MSPLTAQSKSVGTTCLIGLSYRKDVGNVSMLERRFVSAHMDLVMLNFSFEFHTILWAFEKKKFLMLVCLDQRRSIRFLRFPLENIAFELNLSTTEMACCSVMHAHFTHCVVRAKLGMSPRREATSRSVNIFRELFQVVDRTVTSSAPFVSGMLVVRSLVLMRVPI